MQKRWGKGLLDDPFQRGREEMEGTRADYKDFLERFLEVPGRGIEYLGGVFRGAEQLRAAPPGS